MEKIIVWNNKIKNCQFMFYKLSNITNIDFSNFDTSQVTNMSYMFYNCYKLQSLDLNNFNTSNVIDMQYMFANSDLQSLNLKILILQK